MRKIFCLASFAAATSATPTLAQSTDAVTIDGSVAPRCLFTTPSEVINATELALSGSGSAAGKLNASMLDGQSRNLVGWCNGTASTMIVDARPVVNTDYTAAVPTGFERIVNYTATATAGAASTNDSSMLPAVGVPAAIGLYNGIINVALSGSATPLGGLLIAGTYQGSVIVTIAPAVTPPVGQQR